MADMPRNTHDTSSHKGTQPMRHCPLCQQEYVPAQVTELEEVDGARLVHLRCTECSVATLAYVMVTALGMSSIGVVTDLTAHDAARLLQRGAFTQDDVLDFHTVLQRPGQFESALARLRANTTTRHTRVPKTRQAKQ